jgi:hypothetical protein
MRTSNILFGIAVFIAFIAIIHVLLFDYVGTVHIILFDYKFIDAVFVLSSCAMILLGVQVKHFEDEQHLARAE